MKNLIKTILCLFILTTMVNCTSIQTDKEKGDDTTNVLIKKEGKQANTETSEDDGEKEGGKKTDEGNTVYAGCDYKKELEATQKAIDEYGKNPTEKNCIAMRTEAVALVKKYEACPGFKILLDQLKVVGKIRCDIPHPNHPLN